MCDESVTLESTLSHAAARLYIHLLWHGDGWRTKSALMRGAGIRDYRDFDRAWAELGTKGLLDPQTRLVWAGPVPTTEKPVPSTGAPVANTEKSVFTTVSPASVANTAPVPTTGFAVANTAKSVASTEMSVASTAPDADNLEDAIADADEMPTDGDERNPKGNFQLRRKRQIALLQQAWTALFPQQTPLLDLTAKQWLSKARSEAATVLQAMQQTASRDNVQSPRGYIDRIIEDVAKKRELAKREEQGELGDARPVTSEMRARWAKAEEYATLLGINEDDEE